MTDLNRWLLPGGIDEVLPPRAWHVEMLRRDLLDLYRSWGYELVIPPFVEYLESLLTGVGSDLDLQTFKITDQLTGRMMGIRADMTPQVARIDAHSIHAEGTRRLCYGGSVLRTRPQNTLASRSPLQIGAELYGCADIAADIEIVRLMLETLKVVGVQQIHLDLGHVGIYQALVAECELSEEDQAEFFALLQRKANADLAVFAQSHLGMKPQGDLLLALASLHGGSEVLHRASELLANAPEQVQASIEYLTRLAEAVTQSHPEVELYFDLGELRGYQYHTGVIYSAYVPGHGQAVAKGGRYDDIGRVFGRSRPATGFSADLKTLIELAPVAKGASRVIAPADNDPALAEQIRALREQGNIVIQQLPGELQSGAADRAGAAHALERKNGQWCLAVIEGKDETKDGTKDETD